MHRPHYLLPMLLGLLAARGIAPDAMDPWRGWLVFKQYARIVDEVPDPGVSVQLFRHADETASLVFLRQVLELDGDRLEPAGGTVCEMVFPPGAASGPEWDFWSFDYSSFERFVDRVEQHPAFVDLMPRRPEWSDVYWKEA